MSTKPSTSCLLFLSPFKMDPTQSIDDILDETIGCSGE